MKRHRPRRAVETPNLAPMVDVVMVILIFFMLGTSFAASEGALPTQLPADVGPGGSAAVSIIPVVRIGLEEAEDGDGVRIRIMGQALADPSVTSIYTLMRAKREAGADPRGRVVVAAAPGVRYKHVISAFNSCVRAGFENVQFAVSSAAKPQGGPAGD